MLAQCGAVSCDWRATRHEESAARGEPGLPSLTYGQRQKGKSADRSQLYSSARKPDPDTGRAELDGSAELSGLPTENLNCAVKLQLHAGFLSCRCHQVTVTKIGVCYSPHSRIAGDSWGNQWRLAICLKQRRAS